MFRIDEDDRHITMTITNPSQGQEFSWKGRWDATGEEIVEAFYVMLVGLTFPETVALKAMKEFAEERLSILEPEKVEEDD